MNTFRVSYFVHPESTKKDVIYALKKQNALVLELNYSSKSYEDLKNEINEVYQEREVLGDDLELQNILFVNTKIESTNIFQSYLSCYGAWSIFRCSPFGKNYSLYSLTLQLVSRSDLFVVLYR